MAETRPVDPFDIDFSTGDAHRRPIYRRLSILNGLLIGLALGLGAWGMEMARIGRLPVSTYLPALLLGLGLIVALCGLVGWLTGRIGLTPVTVVLWGLTAVACMLILGYLPYYGRTFTVWLLDRQFWGRVIFPYTLEGSPAGLVLGGLLVILVLVGLGLIQNYRLENISLEAGSRGRLSTRGWLSLLIPLPIVFLASLITQSVLSNPAAAAFEITNRAVANAQGYDGDLRGLELGDGISYGALQPVKALLGPAYTLSIVDINPLNSTVIVGVDFAEGGWVNCRVINDQLSFCYDASPPYTEGLRSLVTGVLPAEGCRGCILQTTDEAAAWLAERRDRLGSEPAIYRVAQQGNHVLMRVGGDAGLAVECWVVGVTPMRLTECREVGTVDSEQ